MMAIHVLFSITMIIRPAQIETTFFKRFPESLVLFQEKSFSEIVDATILSRNS